jgi:hypothetical protein
MGNDIACCGPCKDADHADEVEQTTVSMHQRKNLTFDPSDEDHVNYSRNSQITESKTAENLHDGEKFLQFDGCEYHGEVKTVDDPA